MREDLVQSAVSFLTDPKVQSAPLAKKVSFLESKGMTSEEIEEAMARANGKSTTAAPAGPLVNAAGTGGASLAPAQPALSPAVPARPPYDWRDVFIAAVLAGGVGYGIWTLAKRVFDPWFKVPPEEELEKDKEALEAQFQAVEDGLKAIKEQTSEALTTVSDQSDKVKNALESLDAVLKDLKEGDNLRQVEFNTVKGDIDALKDLVPKMMDRNKEAQNAVLANLQNELKSLKSLLLSRNRTNTPEQTVQPAPGQATLPGSNAGSSNGSLASTPA